MQARSPRIPSDLGGPGGAGPCPHSGVPAPTANASSPHLPFLSAPRSLQDTDGKTSRGVDRRCGGPARTRLAAAHECPGLGAPAPGPRAREPAVTPSTGCPDSSHSCAAASSLACLGQAGVDLPEDRAGFTPGIKVNDFGQLAIDYYS